MAKQPSKALAAAEADPAEAIQWRRKSDGYRVTMTDEERLTLIEPDDYEPMEDFTARELGPREAADDEPLDLSGAEAPAEPVEPQAPVATDPPADGGGTVAE